MGHISLNITSLDVTKSHLRTVWDVFGSVSVLISCTGVSGRQGYLTHNMQSGDWPRSRIFNVASLPVPLCIYSYFNWGDVK